MTEREISTEELEEGSELHLDFDKISKVAAQDSGVIPVGVQNADTGEVILIVYTDRKALEKTIERLNTSAGTLENLNP